eukprot:9476855-Pyramimonas_sp.AAC.1
MVVMAVLHPSRASGGLPARMCKRRCLEAPPRGDPCQAPSGPAQVRLDLHHIGSWPTPRYRRRTVHRESMRSYCATHMQRVWGFKLVQLVLFRQSTIKRRKLLKPAFLSQSPSPLHLDRSDRRYSRSRSRNRS